MSTLLDKIKDATLKEISAAKKKRTIGDLRRLSAKAPELRSFKEALSSDFGLIAEIKKKSPSVGDMLPQNVNGAIAAYSRSPIVRAISVLTNASYFGGSIEDLLAVKKAANKPVLRKDFIFKDYQVYEARAFGADAILLMANLIEKQDLHRLYEIATELGLDVLFEAHTKEEIDMLPEGAKILGLNSRKFKSREHGLRYRLAKWFSKRQQNKNVPVEKDFSTDLGIFDLVQYLPPSAIRVAESGVSPSRAASVRDKGFDAILVGTALLTDPDGIEAALRKFEEALCPAASNVASSAHPAKLVAEPTPA